MNLGCLDHYGILYRNSPTVGTGGAVVEALSTVEGGFWLSKIKPSTHSIIAGARDAADTEDIYQCQFIPELEVGMFVDIMAPLREGFVRFQITKSIELGRCEGWKLFCRAIT